MPYITLCPGQQSVFCLPGTLDPPYAPRSLAHSLWTRHCAGFSMGAGLDGSQQPQPGLLPSSHLTSEKTDVQGMQLNFSQGCLPPNHWGPLPPDHMASFISHTPEARELGPLKEMAW